MSIASNLHTDEVNRGTNDQIIFPASFGLKFNPLIMPFAKADLPFDIWIGGELGEFVSTTLKDTTGANDATESIKLFYFQPAITAGFSFNIVGPIDLDAMGGYGFPMAKFTQKYNLEEKSKKFSGKQLWAQGGLDIQFGEVKRLAGVKLGVYYRQNFNEMKDLDVITSDTNKTGNIYPIGKTNYTKMALGAFQIGAKLSFDFGRESNKDRGVRHKLYDRDAELRKHNKNIKPLDEWECMAVERDYKLYIDASGQLADVRHKYNRTEYLDIMETYLAFCKPENLSAKTALYRAMDSNKVVLKNYQESQSDKRYRQVMASNDVEMLTMFLQYYPDHPNKDQVQTKIESLAEYQDWIKAKQAHAFKSYLWYMKKYPDGKYTDDAETGIFNLVKAAHREKDYNIYIKKFPNGKYIHDARKAIHQIRKMRN